MKEYPCKLFETEEEYKKYCNEDCRYCLLNEEIKI
jgi:hypothetical protein